MSGKYRILVSFDPERAVYVARAPELEHCTAEGQTRSEAITKIEEEITAMLENIRERGGSPPTALDDDIAQTSGELTVKISRGLHRDLTWQARVEGVEVGQLAGEMLAQALENRRQARRRPPSPNERPERSDRPPPRDRDQRRNDGRYHAIMEDRATFLEYVRNLDSGQGPPNRGPRRGGGGGGGGRGSEG
jgi:predicted RNase H-like HicB family nuclease